MLGGDQSAQRRLVRRVLVGVQQAHGDRFDPRLDEPADLGLRLLEIERHDDLAVPADALVDLAPQATRHQWLGKFEKQVMDVVALLGPHFEDVAEPLRRQQPDARAAPFDQRVGHQRRAVDQGVEVGHFEAGRRQQLAEAVDRAARRVLRRRQAFV